MNCRFYGLSLLSLLVCFSLVSLRIAPVSAQDAKPAQADKLQSGLKGGDKPAWQPLATSKQGPWEACNFGGDGEVQFAANAITLGMGDPLTGVRLKDDVKFPKNDYEITLEARRTSGFDFFCGLTFPIGEGQASFILGGWSGGVVGLSSIDGNDASENETTAFKTFDNDKWYKVRVRVDDRVRCWIDGKNFVDVPLQGRRFSIRDEMDPSLPLGVACFQTKSELRNLRWRKLEAAELAGDES